MKAASLRVGRDSPIAHLWCIAVCISSFKLKFALCDVLASGQLQSCVRDGTVGASLQLNCTQKLIVTLTVPNGQSIATQELDFSIPCIGSLDGQCPCTCNYATSPSCTCRDLASPLHVSLTKTSLLATYPLQYLQSFNYKPVEVIVRPGPGKCKDSSTDTAPTCGWYYEGGVQVPDSQGFCCTCSSSQIFDNTFGTGNPQRTRANLDCDFFSNPLDILIGKLPTSAHCLQFDAQWFSGYKLGSSSLQFQITVTVTVPTSSASTLAAATNSTLAVGAAIVLNVTQLLVVSPSVPLAVSSGGQVSVTLEGDLAMYTALPVLSNQILMMPQPVTADQSRWMLLDGSLVSLDGTACNLVGTSFSAFRYQASGCVRAPQVCLASQLKDLYAADLRRVAAGKVPLYLTTQYTQGALSELKAFNGGPLSFVLPVTSQSNSIVLLSTTADHLALVTNARAPAGATSMSTSATGGRFDASYTLTVSNCTANIRAVEARTLSVTAGASTQLSPPLQIYVEDNLASASRYCWTTLYDSLGIVTSQRQFFFYTNATVIDLTPTGGYNGTGSGNGTGKASVNCEEVCSNSLDIVCLVLHRCWSRVGKFSGLLSGLVGGALLLALAAKLGLLSSLSAHMHAACCARSALSSLGGKSSPHKPESSSCCGGGSAREVEEGAVVAGGALGAAGVAYASRKTRGGVRGMHRDRADSDEEWERGMGEQSSYRAAGMAGRLAGRRERQYCRQGSAYEESGDGSADRRRASEPEHRRAGGRQNLHVDGAARAKDLIMSALGEHLEGRGLHDLRGQGGQRGRLSGLLTLIKSRAPQSPRARPELLPEGGGVRAEVVAAEGLKKHSLRMMGTATTGQESDAP
ncbi:MAG: hypothetical protein WDW38_007620 [Sanguina aurantia]